MKTQRLYPLVFTALALAGCETTGDPKEGGLFGWSEHKAKARSSALEQALYVEDDRGASTRSSNTRLESAHARNASVIRAEHAKLGRMLSQLDEVEAKGGSTGGLRQRINATRNNDNLEDAALRARVQELDGEVRSMRSEYGLLQQRR
jgi:hypothetical protein